MLKINLATHPFYNERVVHVVLVAFLQIQSHGDELVHFRFSQKWQTRVNLYI